MYSAGANSFAHIVKYWKVTNARYIFLYRFAGFATLASSNLSLHLSLPTASGNSLFSTMPSKRKAEKKELIPNDQDPITPAPATRKRRSTKLPQATLDGGPSASTANVAAPAAKGGTYAGKHQETRKSPKKTKTTTPIKPQNEDEEDEEDKVTREMSTTKHRRQRCSTTTTVVEEEIAIANGDNPPITEQEVIEEEMADIETETIVETIVKTKRRRREPDPLPCIDPTPELLTSLQRDYTPPPRPIPNLGYACLNMDLRELKPAVFTSRDCIKRTLDAKGLPHLGELTLANCKDLAKVIQWNHEHGIRVFRISSVIQPWMGVHNLQNFPQFEEIRQALKFAGDLARVYDQRLTFHPSHFVKLAAKGDSLTEKSIAELEGHSTIFDLMGYEPSPMNKINIHVGGVYGDKEATMQRWADNYRKLSPNCQARVTVENDDVASAFSLEDLLTLHHLCDGNLPLVFDFHHHRFCPGNFTEEEALRAAIATWPKGIRPVVHWSESQRGRKPHAHSDYVKGPIRLPEDLKDCVDVMIESKCKERALIALRDGLPIPEVDDLGVEDEAKGPMTAEAEMAIKLL